MFLTYREEVRGLPEPHLPGGDHLYGVLEGLVLGHLGAVDGDALELEAGLQGAALWKNWEGKKVRSARKTWTGEREETKPKCKKNIK